MAKVVSTTFKLRRDKSNIWQENNPILGEGEPGFEIDTGKLKIGNGVDNCNTLKYINDIIPEEEPEEDDELVVFESAVETGFIKPIAYSQDTLFTTKDGEILLF